MGDEYKGPERRRSMHVNAMKDGVVPWLLILTLGIWLGVLLYDYLP